MQNMVYISVCLFKTLRNVCFSIQSYAYFIRYVYSVPSVVSDSLQPYGLQPARLQSCLCPLPLSMGFSRKEHQSGLSFPPSGDLTNPGIESASFTSPALQADSLLLSHQKRRVSDTFQCNQYFFYFISNGTIFKIFVFCLLLICRNIFNFYIFNFTQKFC